MADAYSVRVESDERGFELHIELEEDVATTDGVLVVNVQGIAEELYNAVKSSIGPWLYEMETARAYHRAGVGPLSEADREEEVRCAALGMEGPNHKQWRAEGGGLP